MAEVPNLKQYIKRISKSDNPGEGNLEGGVTADVDLMNIGRLQTVKFHKNGVSLDDGLGPRLDSIMARWTELNDMLPEDEKDNPESQVGNFSQAINENIVGVVFSLEVLLKLQAQAIDRLMNRVRDLETPNAT